MILTATTVVLPVFFVLALGYFAGRARKFGPDQVAGLSELVLDYALPAMLFVATVKTPRERLLSEGAYALALLIAIVGLFLVVVFVSTRILHTRWEKRRSRQTWPVTHQSPFLARPFSRAYSAHPVFSR